MVALPKPPEDPKKSKGSLVVVLPAVVALLLLLLVKVSAEELVFIFEEHIELKGGKNCNFSKKNPDFSGKKNAFLVVLNFFSGAKIDFLPFLKWQKMWFCTFEIALIF